MTRDEWQDQMTNAEQRRCMEEYEKQVRVQEGNRKRKQEQRKRERAQQLEQEVSWPMSRSFCNG
jgi:hypothetical protein